MQKPLVFVSYRRDDEGPASRFIKVELDKIFGSEHIFMDLDNIRRGDKWKDTINTSLQECDCLIVIIGKNWLRLQDENFIRRIDKKEDWVRKEVETALRRKIKIVPLLMGGVTLPQKEALPKSIQKLPENQAMSINALTWQNDISDLVDFLIGIGFKRKDKSVSFPNPQGIKDTFPLALSDNELNSALKELSGWELSYEPIPGQSPKEMQEISKKFEFKSFEDAINFMSNTSTFISKKDHHPRWENLWRTLFIHLSTWDIGHKVSKLDTELAKFFDEQFEAFYSYST
jgi:pterin-4a-carbinolamine dehydratase